MIPLCFFNKDCIAKRKAEEAAAQAQIAQQQQLLQQIAGEPTGGLSALAITGIVIGLVGLSFVTVYYIKKSKKK